VYANIFFALVVCILNARSIRRFIHYRQEWYKTFFVPAISSIIMAGAVHLVYTALHTFAGNTFSTLVSIIIGIMVYGIGLVTFKGIAIEEIATFPKGHLLIKLLRKMGLFRE
jgi:stage V sporulation protein B